MQESLLCAAGGGLAMSILGLVELQTVPRDRWPDFRSVLYWVPFVALPLLGLGLAYVYLRSGVELKPLMAANVGASAPLLVRALASTVPKASPKVPPGA